MPLESEGFPSRVFRRISGFFLTALTLLCFSASSFTQIPPAETLRKIKEEYKPEYPELAKRLRLSGVVRVEVLIAPDGKVTRAHVIGGHPVLAEPAEKAARLTKFETGPKESTQVIDFRFEADK